MIPRIMDFIVRPFVTATRTLTIFPVPGKDVEDFSRTLVWFPLVGGLLSLVLFAIFAAGRMLFPAENYLTAILMFTGMAVVTGGLHLDGLADVADGFGGGHTRERILEIMKDPRQGTFGVLALIIDALLKIALYFALISQGAVLIAVLSIIVSRGLQPMVMAFLPYARKEGGMAQNFCGDPSSRPAAITALAVVMTVLFLYLPALQAGIGFLCAVCASGLFAWYCLYRIGGVTGDCIGAVNETAELAFLMAIVIMKNLGA